MRRSITALFALVVVMGASVAAYGALGGADRGPLPRAASIEPSPVRVTGNVENLFPGVTTPLPIRVRNRTDGPVRLQWVRAIVGEPSAGCDPSYLQAARIDPHRRIPPRGSIDLVMPLTLSSEAPDGCQDAIFPFLYRTRVNVLGAGG
jgi:hypothetical protein